MSTLPHAPTNRISPVRFVVGFGVESAQAVAVLLLLPLLRRRPNRPG